jgi:hypothetical protein
VGEGFRLLLLSLLSLLSLLPLLLGVSLLALQHH